MAYEITFDETTQVISVIFSGLTDLETKLRAVEEVTVRFGDLEKLKFLIDVREQKMNMLLGEQEAFGEYVANHHVLRRAKVAVLHEPNFNSNDIIDVSAYKNGYRIGQFSSHSDATKWLATPCI